MSGSVKLILETEYPSDLHSLLLSLANGLSGATIINSLERLEESMASQEERLQAILVAVQNVKQMLADLKTNNPAIEDEISAIEAELAPATEPAPEPPPSPEG